MANISNDTQSKIVYGTSSGDYIKNTAAYATVYGYEGDDTVYNTDISHWSVIDAGAGNDSIYSYMGDFGTIIGGTGDDTILIYSLNSKSNLIIYNEGDGNDIIAEGYSNTDWTLQIGDGTGTYSSQTSGSNIILSVGTGKIIIQGAANMSTANIAGTYVNPLLIVGTDGADMIENIPANATVNALGGNDYISNYGSNVSINAGAGNDSIKGCSKDSKIDGGAGDDYIEHVSGLGPDFGNNTLLGGTGNDTISSDCDNVTIDGGEGNDYIVNGNTDSNGYNVSINGGDGNNWIWNHGSFVTIRTGSGADNVWSDHSNNLIDTGAGNDNIDNDSTNSTINAGEGDDFIQAGERSTVYAGAGKDSVLVVKSDNVIFAQDGNDSIKIQYDTNNISVDGGTGNDIFINEDGKNITFTYTKGDGNDSIYGFNETSTLSISGGTYSTQQGSKKDIIVTVGEGSITLKDAANLSNVNISGKEVITNTWTFDDMAANYGKEGNILITVNGVESSDGLEVQGDVVKISAAALGTSDVTISDGYTLSLAGDVASPTTTPEGWTLKDKTATYKTENVTEGYTLSSDGKSITYTAAKAAKTLATVAGVKSLDSLTIDKKYKVVTVSKASLDTSEVTLSGDYSLALGNDVTKSVTTPEGWTLDDGTATYKTENVTEGYVLSDGGKSITYSKSKTATTLATLTGVKSVDGLAIDTENKIVTLSLKSLGTDKVTVDNNGYTLALGSDVETPTTTEESWSYANNAATYTGESTSAGYTLSNNEIIYSTAKDAETFKVSGVTSKDGLSLKGKVVTVSAKSLGTKNITINDGYTLALAKGVSTPTAIDAEWKLDGTTATYYSESTSKGYTLSSDGKTIKYSGAIEATALAAINGVKSVDGLTVSGNIIKTTAAALSSNVSVGSDDYGFEFVSAYKSAKIIGNGDDDTIKTAGQKVTVDSGAGNDSIVSSGKYAFIEGGAGNDFIKATGAGATLLGGKGNDTLTGGSGANDFVYANGDGKDVITNYNEQDRISIKSGAENISTSGDDVIFTIGKGSITVKDAANKIITYFDAKGEEKIYTDKPVIYNAAGTTAILTVNYTDDAFTPTEYKDYNSKLKNIDASAVQSGLKLTGNKLANSIIGNNQDNTISGADGADILCGEGGNDSLSGGKGNDTLAGGTGNDTLFGGAGSDIFVYSNGDGNDVITDYNEGQGDKIKIASGKVTSITPVKKDIVFTVGKGKLTVNGAAEQAITWIDANDKENIYVNNPVTYNEAGTTATLTEHYTDDEFTPTEYADYKSKLATIDASAVTHDLKITANKIANSITGSTQDDFIDGAAGADVIYGGAGADTLYGNAGNDKLFGEAGNDSLSGGAGADTLEGGAGKDTLVGGAGADLFVYNNGDGNDLITDYSEKDGDKISIASGSVITITTSKANVIFTVGKGKITVNGAADQLVTYIENNDEKIYTNKKVIYNEAGTSATLTYRYTDDAFTSTNYKPYRKTLATIDASAVIHDLKITGSKLANIITGSGQDDTIDGAAGADKLYGGAGNDSLFGGKGNDALYGGDGNDTLWGGAGNDTLTGGDGNDTFIYNAGEGNKTITDYSPKLDKVIVNSGVTGYAAGTSGNLVFTMTDGAKLTFTDCADKTVLLKNTFGKTVKNGAYYGG